MKNWYLNLSIKYKLLIMFYFFLALLSILFYVYNTRIASANMLENVGNANISILEQINSNVLFLRREVEDMTTQLMIQPQVQAYIQPYDAKISETQRMYIDSSLKNAVNLITSKDYISSLSICGFENHSVPFIRSIDSRFSLPDYKEMIETDFFKQATEAKGGPIWLENSDETYLFAANNRYNRIFMVRVIREYNTYENLGLIVAGISEPALRREYTRGIDTSGCSVAIFNKDGSLVSAAGSESLTLQNNDNLASFREQKNGYKVIKSDGKPLLVSFTNSGKTGWTYLYAVPTDTLTEKISNSANYIIPFFAAALLLFLPLILFASGLIIRPIGKLLSAMRSFESGNFDSTLSFRYEDEIGQLGKGYNEMVASLANLIERVYILQIKEQEAELNSLQSQINPHFLYNTLDSIYWKAQSKGESEIAEMVWMLSNLFRTSLSKGTRYTSVSHEFQFLEQYLRLQRLRYGSRINYNIDLDEDTKELMIPKLILQPLVENAIYHGLEPKEGNGTVSVSCLLSDDQIIFRIADDGVGVDQTILAQLREEDHELELRGTHALKNVRERLEILYPGRFSMKIESQKDKGTAITLVLPQQLEDTHA